MKKIFDLPICGYDRAKSFYGKAKIIETENGEKVLQSYNTFVCRITAAGRFVRMWGGYSATTMRHVNSFLSFYDMLLLLDYLLLDDQIFLIIVLIHYIVLLL